MSSHSANQSSPPQSTQPYPFQSIFGGPSSQDVNTQPPPGNQQTAGREGDEDRVDIDIEEFLPPVGGIIDQSASDDATYHDTDDEEEIEFKSENEVTGSGKDGEHDAEHNESVGVRLATSHVNGSDTGRSIHASSPPLPSSPLTYRPNRFTGPEPTWRKLTFEERQTAQALETIRARDLSAHLYNAYALRVRACEIARRAVEGTNEGQRVETGYFVPPKKWTAWPMSANEVPRPDEHLRRQEDEVWTLRMQPDSRPSAGLEESLIAVMLKIAKERIEARGWEDSEPGPPAFSALEHGNWADDNHYESTGDEERDYKSEPDSVDEIPLYPVVQADDEKSRRQLQPLARGIITQVDQLLMGLHHARRNDITSPEDVSASGWNTDAPENEYAGTPRPKKRTRMDMEKNRSRTNKRARKSRESINDDDLDGATEANRARLGRSQSSSRHGFRDWSQVLGFASIIGLPSAAVMRAAQRCSNLFGEDMEFRTLREGYLRQVERDEEAPAWVYSENESENDELCHEPAPTHSPPRSSCRSQSRHTGRHPQKKSSRAGSPAAETGTITTAAVPTTPTAHADAPSVPTHGHDQSEMAVSTNARSGGTDRKSKGKGKNRKRDLVCPIEGCRRHNKGFSRTWNLNLHLKRVHPGYIQRNPEINVGSPVNLSSNDEMDG